MRLASCAGWDGWARWAGWILEDRDANIANVDANPNVNANAC